MTVAMNFERTMRLLFGEKAYHIADEHGSVQGRRTWLTKALQLLTQEVDKLDTTVRHQQMLMGELEAIAALVKTEREASWSLVYRLFRLASRLMGFDYVHGSKCHTAIYWQTPAQNLNSVVFEGGDIMQDYYDKQNAIAVRRSLVFRSININTYYAIPMSNLFHRNTTGSWFISSIPLRMRALSSSSDATRIWRRNVRAIFENAHSMRFSQEPCLGV